MWGQEMAKEAFGSEEFFFSRGEKKNNFGLIFCVYSMVF